MHSHLAKLNTLFHQLADKVTASITAGDPVDAEYWLDALASCSHAIHALHHGKRCEIEPEPDPDPNFPSSQTALEMRAAMILHGPNGEPPPDGVNAAAADPNHGIGEGLQREIRGRKPPQ